MQLLTQSKIYYGHQITLLNRYIDFSDAVGTQVAVLSLGYYTPTELAAEIVRKMNAQSLTDFTCTYNRTTRIFTIAGSGTFSLLSNTGAHFGSTVFALIGFSTAANYIGAATYTAPTASGSVYATQFFLQSFVHPDNNSYAIDPVLNKTASGVTELIKYGDESFAEFELFFVTNEIQESNSIVRTNVTGVDDTNALMTWLTNKGHIELMLDEADLSTYLTLMLESTEKNSMGLDYNLIEMIDKNLPNYFRSGLLKFRQF